MSNNIYIKKTIKYKCVYLNIRCFFINVNKWKEENDFIFDSKKITLKI